MQPVLRALLASLLILVAACGPAGLPASTAAGAAPLRGEARLVWVEANWLCDVQRHAYPDLDAMGVAFETFLRNNEVSRQDYDAFKARLEQDSDLRGQVMAEYQAACT